PPHLRLHGLRHPGRRRGRGPRHHRVGGLHDHLGPGPGRALPPPLPELTRVIEYRDVYKAFDVPVLSGVSLEVATGDAISIGGPSGTGKSVLLKTTNGLLVPDLGDVLVDGVDRKSVV